MVQASSETVWLGSLIEGKPTRGVGQRHRSAWRPSPRGPSVEMTFMTPDVTAEDREPRGFGLSSAPGTRNTLARPPCSCPSGSRSGTRACSPEGVSRTLGCAHIRRHQLEPGMTSRVRGLGRPLAQTPSRQGCVRKARGLLGSHVPIERRQWADDVPVSLLRAWFPGQRPRHPSFTPLQALVAPKAQT